MRILSLILYFSCLIWSSLTLGADCNSPSMVSNDILACVTISYKEIDKKLNDQYKFLKLNDDPSNKKLLVNSERAWIKYRDARCNEVYELVYPGKEAEIERVSCQASMASSRLTELIYIETGVFNDNFDSSLSMLARVSSKGRDEIIDYINGEAVIPEGAEYFKRNCELTEFLYQENSRACSARMRLQAI